MVASPATGQEVAPLVSISISPEAGQGHLAPFQELGVRDQADLDEDAGHGEVPDLARGAILVIHAHHLLPSPITSVVRALMMSMLPMGGPSQHVVGAQGIGELHYCDVFDDAGQIDGRLDAGVTATDHCDPPLEEGPSQVGQ